MTDANEKNIKDILGTDAASQEVAEKAVAEAKKDLDEEMRLRKIKLIKIGSALMFVAIMMIIMTIAWFTMNKETSATGGGVKVATMPFEVAAYGDKGVRYNSIITDQESEYQSGTEYIYPSGAAEPYYKTGEGTDSIKLRYQTGESEIGPGGSGICDLYIIPNRDGDLTVNISMDVVAYAYVDVYDRDSKGKKIQSTEEVDNGEGETVLTPVFDESGDPVYDTTNTLMCISDINTDDCKITEDELTELQKDADYLKGHIMFFGGVGSPPVSNREYLYTEENNLFYYTDPRTDRTITKTIDDAEEGTPYPIPIRWMWPNTFGQLALQTNVNELRSGIPVIRQEAATLPTATPANGKRTMLNYLETNKDNIFKDIDLSSLISLLSDEQKEIYDGKATAEEKAEYLSGLFDVDLMIEDADSKPFFDVLSKGYNKADLAIGSNIAYFLIEITVTGS